MQGRAVVSANSRRVVSADESARAAGAARSCVMSSAES